MKHKKHFISQPYRSLQWCHNERNGISNHQRLDCSLNPLFRHRSKNTSKHCVAGLCEGIHRWPVDSPQRVSNAENASIWWHHHVSPYLHFTLVMLWGFLSIYLASDDVLDSLETVYLQLQGGSYININYNVLMCLNTLRPRQNGRHFPDDVIKCIFLNESIWISIEISLKLVPKGPINNIPALVQIMAWHRPGDKPLSEPMMVRLPTHMRHSASMG